MDDTIHTTPDGIRTDKEGVPVQWPNWQPGQWIHSRAQSREEPLMETAGKNVNQWDDTVHFTDGTRAFGNGVKLQWPNW